MLQIINQEGITLQPDNDTVVPVEVFNPLFNENNELFQEIIYSAQAGLTEINKAFINNGHLVEAGSKSYEQPVTVFYRGSAFYAGVFRHKITGDKISFELKVNFGTIAQKIKTANLVDIITMDLVEVASQADMEKLMFNSCKDPDQYPFAFFPVKNAKWLDWETPVTYPWINQWDYDAQKFKVDWTKSPITPGSFGQAPFFKLSYILKKIFECLQFTLEGDILSDPEFNSVYLYTKKPLVYSYRILPSMCYMSDNLTVSNFLKQISTRMHLNFNYNVLNNTVTVESPITALNDSAEINLSRYVESIEEISTPETKGYSVTLKPDETDEMFDVSKDDAKESDYKAAFTLRIGDAQNPIELEVSTLKQTKDTNYSYPETKQETAWMGVAATYAFPVRLLKFYGMKTISGSKVFPEAYAYDLGEDDAAYYQFLNDSKKVILNTKVPASVLSKFRPTSKFGFSSSQGNYQKAINAKYSYNLTGQNTELIAVKIECQTTVLEYDTTFSIEPYVPEEETDKRVWKYKFCYEDGSQPAGDSLKVVPVPNTGSPVVMAATAAGAPADIGGMGGQTGRIYVVSGLNGRDTYGYKVRIYDRKPLYAILDGKKHTFTKESDYYVINGLNTSDGRPALIVF